jgi:hypothetical protein
MAMLSLSSMTRRHWIIAFAILAGTMLVQWLMGRPAICTCGTIELWGPVGPKQSQMIADWYSPSHLVHGPLFYLLLWWLFPKWSVGKRFTGAMLIECAWELAENTPLIIDRYREATAALGYNGDSMLNSFSDVIMMGIGFWIARKAPVWVSLMFVLALELVALAVIRDNLTLNVWMLLWPNEAVVAWQSRA